MGVTAAFDLNLFPFYRIKGQEWPQLPGLLAMVPPHRTARGRENDRLVIYLTFSGNDPFSASEYNQTAVQMARQFYQTAGSVTSAIRAIAETLNQLLVDRNLRTTGKGQYIIGRMILGVLRGSQFVFAQCGPTHVFHLPGKETRHVHDAQMSGRGLGIGQATPLYLSQLDLNPGDQLILCADLPSGWEAALLGKGLVLPDSLRRELLSITTEDLNAILVHVLPGKGNINILKAMPAPAPDTVPPKRQTAFVKPTGRPAPVSAPTTAAPDTLPASEELAAESTPSMPQESAPVPASPAIPTSQVESGRPASRFASLLAGSGKDGSAGIPNPEIPQMKTETPVTAFRPRVKNDSTEQVRPPVPDSKSAVSRPAPQTGRFVSSRTTGELPEIKRPPAYRKGIYRWLANIILGIRGGTQKISDSIRKFLPNVLPDSNEGESQGSSSSLAFVAIAIPLIVVTIAGLVYARYGRVTQYQDYYNMALSQAAQAHGQTDPTEVRRAWDSTLYYLALADKYQVTQDSLNLRQQAQTALDNLDSIVRLNFSPAIVGGLDRTLQINRMAATNTDLYLLDATRGNVIRAALGNQGYEIDSNFVCGPAQYGTITVGKLIDIEALQMSNDFNARVMGIDASGTLLYCGFNMVPEAVPLSPPPLGWQGISAFTLDTDGRYLYVLDPPGNNVWAYQGNSGKFTDSPTIFFGQQVPQSMSTSIDLAANNSDLYLLFEDGHVTACPASHYEGVPLRCSDPVTFVDNRPERQPGPRITDAIFNQISFAAAPDPLLYLLEPLTRAIYYFSPRSDSLELRGQFRAGVEQSNTLFNSSATAMTISPNRNIFFSIGAQVFFATNVP
ncbi:MAG TPA: hypothetical protein VF359_02370 [Anaerolineales bacterium]